MKIAICDDEKVFVNKIYNYLCLQPDCCVERFLTPSALLRKYETGERYDVLFLDILMKPMDGISLSRAIRYHDPHAIIVFLTAYLEYAPAGYEVNAFRYLLKPITKRDLLQVMKDIRHELESSHKVLFRTPQSELILHTGDILYLEANDKETTISSDKGTFVLHKGLNELSAQLSSSLFFRIHRKYIVNLSRVREFTGTHLTLDSGYTLPVSRRNSRAFRNTLKTYIEGGLH